MIRVWLTRRPRGHRDHNAGCSVWMRHTWDSELPFVSCRVTSLCGAPLPPPLPRIAEAHTFWNDQELPHSGASGAGCLGRGVCSGPCSSPAGTSAILLWALGDSHPKNVVREGGGLLWGGCGNASVQSDMVLDIHPTTPPSTRTLSSTSGGAAPVAYQPREAAPGRRSSAFLWVQILSFMFPLAVSLAVSTRIGNHLGATASCAARRCCRIALLLNEGVGVAISLLWLLLRRAWAAAFTADATVIECTAELVALMAVFQLFDVLSCTMSCALRGAGLQAQGAALMLAGQWGLGVPLGLGLGFRVRLGLLGLWAGLGLGTVATVALEGVLLAGLDWDALAARACTRVMGEGEGRAEVPLRDGVGVEGGLKGGEGGQAPGYRTF